MPAPTSDTPVEETPVLDLLAGMTAASIAASSLDPDTLMLVRIAALVAVDAPPVSYLMNLGAAGEVGIDAEGSAVSLPRSPRSSVQRGSRPRPGRSSRRSRSTSRSPRSPSEARGSRAPLGSPVAGGRAELRVAFRGPSVGSTDD